MCDKDQKLLWEAYQQLNEALSPQEAANSILGAWPGREDFSEIIKDIKSAVDPREWNKVVELIKSIPDAEIPDKGDLMTNYLQPKPDVPQLPDDHESFQSKYDDLEANPGDTLENNPYDVANDIVEALGAPATRPERESISDIIQLLISLGFADDEQYIWEYIPRRTTKEYIKVEFVNVEGSGRETGIPGGIHVKLLYHRYNQEPFETSAFMGNNNSVASFEDSVRNVVAVIEQGGDDWEDTALNA